MLPIKSGFEDDTDVPLISMLHPGTDQSTLISNCSVIRGFLERSKKEVKKKLMEIETKKVLEQLDEDYSRKFGEEIKLTQPQEPEKKGWLAGWL